MPSAVHLEASLLALGAFALLSEVSGGGVASGLILSAFGLLITWLRIPRGVLVLNVALAITFVFDMIYMGVFAAARGAAPIVFLTFALLAKCAAVFYSRRLLFELGGGYNSYTGTSAQPMLGLGMEGGGVDAGMGGGMGVGVGGTGGVAEGLKADVPGAAAVGASGLNVGAFSYQSA